MTLVRSGGSLDEVRQYLDPDRLVPAVFDLEVTGLLAGIIIAEVRYLGLPREQVDTRTATIAETRQIEPSLVDKWLSAASVLRREFPQTYVDTLRALALGEAIPALPAPSRLLEVRRTIRGLTGEDRTLALETLLSTRMRRSERDHLLTWRYPADPIARRALLRIDRRIDHDRTAPEDLRELFNRAREGLVPIADARARLQRLRAQLVDACEMAELLDADLATDPSHDREEL